MSKNFEFLSESFPNLYEFTALAEKNIFSNPERAMIKMRGFIETLVRMIYTEFCIPTKKTATLHERLKNLKFMRLVGYDILPKFHSVRLIVNKIVHPKIGDKPLTDEEQIETLKNVYDISVWYYKVKTGKDAEMDFIPPLKEEESPKSDQSEEEKKNIEEIAQFEIPDNQETAEDKQEQKRFSQKSSEVCAEIKIDNSVSERILDENDSLEVYFDNYTLSPSQSEALRKIADFLRNPQEHIFLLKGYAGTGKTFIVKGLVEFLANKGRCYKLAAPTGKASQVLAQKAGANAGTLHSLIYNISGMKEYKTEDLEDSETYRFYADLKVNDNPANTVYVVDEASMVSDSDSQAEFIKFGSGKLLSDFLEYVNLDNNDHDKKIIFLGDPAQLPPVASDDKKGFSPALSANYLKDRLHGAPATEFLMTDIVRQGEDSGILNFANQIRAGIENNDFYKLRVEPASSDIQISTDFESGFREIYDGSKTSLKNSMIIARENSRIADLNQSVRKILFPDAPLHASGKTELQTGDKLIITKTAFIRGDTVYNGDYGLVTAVKDSIKQTAHICTKNKETNEKEEKNITISYRIVDLLFKDVDNRLFKLPDVYIIENLLYSNQVDLSSDEKKSQYINFKMRMGDKNIKPNSEEFKNNIKTDPFFNALCVKFGYAITCHKAQGSEWDYVIADVFAQNRNKTEYFHWLYTAVTRCKRKLYLLNFRNMDVGSEIKAPVDFGRTETMVQSERGQNDTQDANFDTEETPIAKINRFVLSALDGTDIKIISTKSNAYMEEYVFGDGAENSIFDIYYNGNSFITNVTPRTRGDLFEKISERIDTLRGCFIGRITIDKATLTDNFKIDFDAKISKIAEENGFRIIALNEIQNALRYTFFKNDRISVLDFSYRGTTQDFLAAPKVVKKFSSSETEANDLACLIAKHLQEC